MIRRYKYYPWKAPNYWIISSFVAVMAAALSGPNGNHVLIATVALVALSFPRWRSLVLIGQTAMILSNERVFIRGVTSRYGVRREHCIVVSIMHIGARYGFNIWKFEDLRRGGKAIYFFGDNFDFETTALARFSSSLGQKKWGG